MPFGMVSAVCQRMGVLDGGGDHQRGRGSFGGEIGASHCNKWGLRDAALSKLLWAGFAFSGPTSDLVISESYSLLDRSSPNFKDWWSESHEFDVVSVFHVHAFIMEIGEAIKNPAYRIFQTEYSGCLDISAHA